MTSATRRQRLRADFPFAVGGRAGKLVRAVRSARSPPAGSAERNILFSWSVSPFAGDCDIAHFDHLHMIAHRAFGKNSVIGNRKVNALCEYGSDGSRCGNIVDSIVSRRCSARWSCVQEQPMGGVRPNASENGQISPSTTVRAARTDGSRPNLTSILQEAGKPRIFKPVWESSGESRLKLIWRDVIFQRCRRCPFGQPREAPSPASPALGR